VSYAVSLSELRSITKGEIETLWGFTTHWGGITELLLHRLLLVSMTN